MPVGLRPDGPQPKRVHFRTGGPRRAAPFSGKYGNGLRFFWLSCRHTLVAMLANYLAAALRHLVRSRFYATLSIAGLAVGVCVLMLMLLVVRNELGYNRFVREADRAYVAVSVLRPKQHPADYQPA